MGRRNGRSTIIFAKNSISIDEWSYNKFHTENVPNPFDRMCTSTHLIDLIKYFSMIPAHVVSETKNDPKLISTI